MDNIWSLRGIFLCCSCVLPKETLTSGSLTLSFVCVQEQYHFCYEIVLEVLQNLLALSWERLRLSLEITKKLVLKALLAVLFALWFSLWNLTEGSISGHRANCFTWSFWIIAKYPPMSFSGAKVTWNNLSLAVWVKGF